MASRQRGRRPSRQQTEGQELQPLQAVSTVSSVTAISAVTACEGSAGSSLGGACAGPLERGADLGAARSPFLEDLEACLVGMA